MDIITVSNLNKSYQLGSVMVQALQAICISIPNASFTVLAGPSGCGKTTLLNLIGCLDKPDTGTVHIDGCAVGDLSEKALADFRCQHLGFVFQNFNLLPALTAAENIEYPLVLAKYSSARRKQRVQFLLNAVGLESKGIRRPHDLSGGERQRVAIARALACGPRVVLADEPTANLDSHTGNEIIALMRKLQREHNTTFLFASHDPKLITGADKVIHMKDGILHMGEILQNVEQEIKA